MASRSTRPDCMRGETLPIEPSQARGHERRRRILDAGLRLFAERGYERTRIEDLAEAAGASPGLVYRYFTSKRQLLLYLMNEYLELLSSQRLEDVDVHADPLLLAEELLRRSLATETPYAGMWRAWREAVRVDPTLRPLHEKVTRWVRAYSATVFQAAQDAGIASKFVDPEALAFVADAAIWALAELPARERERLVPQVARIVLAPLEPSLDT